MLQTTHDINFHHGIMTPDEVCPIPAEKPKLGLQALAGAGRCEARRISFFSK